jgi:hypothetical protein
MPASRPDLSLGQGVRELAAVVECELNFAHQDIRQLLLLAVEHGDADLLQAMSSYLTESADRRDGRTLNLH